MSTNRHETVLIGGVAHCVLHAIRTGISIPSLDSLSLDVRIASVLKIAFFILAYSIGGFVTKK